MSRFAGLRRLFRLVGRPPSIEQDIDVELDFHFTAQMEALKARGLSDAEASAEATRRFGDPSRTRTELRRIDRGVRRAERRSRWVEEVVQDIRSALRGLRRRPGFAAVVMLTLGIGIGATATMYGVVDRLLLKPPAHVYDPERLGRVRVTETFSQFGTFTNTAVSWKDYVNWRRDGRFHEAIAAQFSGSASLGRGAEARRINVTIATASFFPLLGVTPARGRFYTEEEDREGAGIPVAVLSWDFWQREFGGDTAALGRQLMVGSQTYTVIGIAPPGFTGIELSPVALWLPLHAGAAEFVGRSGEWRDTYDWQWVRVLARLRAGLTREQASGDASRIRAAAGADDRDLRAIVRLVPVQAAWDRGTPLGSNARVAVWLLGVALAVLLVVCANVANLLLARGVSRSREVAVRLALGVSRGRLVRQLLTESLLLAVGGLLIGLAIARWGGDLLRATLLPDTRVTGSPLDWRVAGIAAAATLLTGLLAGLAPALQAIKPGLLSALRGGGEGGTRRRARLRTGLLVAQATLSVVLLIGAGLFVLSLRRVLAFDLGYDPRGVVVADVDLDGVGYGRADQLAFYERARDRLATLPAVERASLGIEVPFWWIFSKRIIVPGHDTANRPRAGGPYYNAVTPDYLQTLGLRLVRGRWLREDEGAAAPPVMVVNDAMARFYWPGREALGQCVFLNGDSLPCSTVVGVVNNSTHQVILEEQRLFYYVPLAQAERAGMSRTRALFLKTRGRPEEAIPAIRRELAALAPNLPYANVRTFWSMIEPQVQPWRLGAMMFGLFGLTVLIVAALGLYSVMSYAVAQRTHEFGIRTALGATPGRVVRSVVGDGLRLAGGGVALGLLAALVLGRFAGPLLFRTSPREPAVFLLVATTLLAAAVAASFLPARRATRVDPLEALRAE